MQGNHARGACWRAAAWGLFVCLAAAAEAWAASLEVELRSAAGDPIPDAVAALYADPAPAGPSRAAAAGATPQALMDQRGQQFVPHVLPIQVGTDVRFPNSDQIRHHVYSFSEAKTFELKLYSGVPADPVRFDRAGIVVLGCNIHDHMLGYIDVLETPHFASTGPDGRARLSDLPAGRYRLELWHPRSVAGHELPPQLVEIGVTDTALRLETEVLPSEVHEEQADEGLHELEQKFRRHRKP